MEGKYKWLVKHTHRTRKTSITCTPPPWSSLGLCSTGSGPEGEMRQHKHFPMLQHSFTRCQLSSLTANTDEPSSQYDTVLCVALLHRIIVSQVNTHVRVSRSGMLNCKICDMHTYRVYSYTQFIVQTQYPIYSPCVPCGIYPSALP